MPALPSNAKTAASARKAARRNEADRDFMWGLIWLLGGIALTAASHSFASQDGGSFWIFIGAMAYGAGRIIRGACTLWLMR
ncbi:MAG TPA: hypothetical protein VD994_06115 [Prosthecobacter sp.]|nr:hypothetical protein [Prosthecobacter sp.]